MKEFFKKYKKWVLGAAVFLLLVCFFSDLNIFGYIKTKGRVNRLHQEIERYEGIIAEDSIFMHHLRHDDRFLEKYAREKHLMHAEDEKLFIIE